MESIKKEIQLFIGLVIAYGIFFFLNNSLTEALYVVPGAHIVHLPSGLKIFMVMLAGFTGALAIFLVGFFWAVLYMFKENYTLSLMLSLVSGLVPWLSLALLRHKIPLNRDLSDLTWKKLLTIVLTFAALNSASLQLIVYSYGESTDLLNGIWVMLVGDITGIFIMIYAIRFLIRMREAIIARSTDNFISRFSFLHKSKSNPSPNLLSTKSLKI